MLLMLQKDLKDLKVLQFEKVLGKKCGGIQDCKTWSELSYLFHTEQ